MMPRSASHSHQRVTDPAKQASGFRPIRRPAAVVEAISETFERRIPIYIRQHRNEVDEKYGQGISQDGLAVVPRRPLPSLPHRGR